MSADWKVKRYTRGISKIFVVREIDEVTPKNISGFTITLRVWDRDTTIISSTCTICSATIGGCYYTVVSGSFLTPKRYNYEIVLADSSDLVRNPTMTYIVNVEDSAPGVG